MKSSNRERGTNLNRGARTIAAAAVTICLIGVLAGGPLYAGGSDEVERGFERLYGEVAAAAERGELPAEVGARALELRTGVRQQLIEADAAIEIQRLIIDSYEGAREAEAVARLVEVATLRERALQSGIRELQRLAGAASTPAGPPTPANAKAAKEPQVGDPPSKPAQKGKITIEFEPEDLIKKKQWVE